MSNCAATLHALTALLSDEPGSPDVLLDVSTVQVMIHLLLVRRDKGRRRAHQTEAAHLHRRLRVVYGELGGYPFRDGDTTYYDGPTLYEAARWLTPAR